MARDVIELEHLLRDRRTLFVVDGVPAIDDADVPPLACRIDDWLEQLTVAESVTQALRWYSDGRVTADHPAVAALIVEIEAWAQRGAEGRDPEAHRAEVTAAIRSIFEQSYGTSHGDAWIEVDTTDFMRDPAVFLETVADHFGIAMPVHGTNRDVIAFVLARWPP